MLEVYQSTNSAPVLVGFEGRETVLPACTVAGLIAVPPTVSNVTVYVVFSFLLLFSFGSQAATPNRQKTNITTVSIMTNSFWLCFILFSSKKIIQKKRAPPIKGTPAKLYPLIVAL